MPPAGYPDYVDTFTRWSATAGRDVRFVVCNNLDTLIWLANLASLELHIALSTQSAYDTPDFLLFDIDPEPPLSFDDVLSVARVVREHLEDAGTRPYVKTSGKKGLHIIVPLASGHSFEEVRVFAHGTGKRIARDVPYVVSEFPAPGIPGPSSSITSRTPAERPWQPPTRSGRPRVQVYPPRSAGTKSGRGYIPKILISGQ